MQTYSSKAEAPKQLQGASSTSLASTQHRVLMILIGPCPSNPRGHSTSFQTLRARPDDSWKGPAMRSHQLQPKQLRWDNGWEEASFTRDTLFTPPQHVTTAAVAGAAAAEAAAAEKEAARQHEPASTRNVSPAAESCLDGPWTSLPKPTIRIRK